MGSGSELMEPRGRSLCWNEDNLTSAAVYEVSQISGKALKQLGEDNLDLLGVAEKAITFDLRALDHTRENSCSGQLFDSR